MCGIERALNTDEGVCAFFLILGNSKQPLLDIPTDTTHTSDMPMLLGFPVAVLCLASLTKRAPEIKLSRSAGCRSMNNVEQSDTQRTKQKKI